MAQSIEPNIADLANGWLKSYKLNYKLEQESLNTEIDKSLSDYFTKNGETYDVIFDIMNKSSFEKCEKSLTQNGVYLLASFKMKQAFQMIRTAKSNGKKVIYAMSSEKVEDLLFVKELVEAGKIKAIIDKRFPLSQTVKAHQYAESGEKKGSIVITLGDSK